MKDFRHRVRINTGGVGFYFFLSIVFFSSVDLCLFMDELNPKDRLFFNFFQQLCYSLGIGYNPMVHLYVTWFIVHVTFLRLYAVNHFLSPLLLLYLGNCIWFFTHLFEISYKYNHVFPSTSSLDYIIFFFPFEPFMIDEDIKPSINAFMFKFFYILFKSLEISMQDLIFVILLLFLADMLADFFYKNINQRKLIYILMIIIIAIGCSFFSKIFVFFFLERCLILVLLSHLKILRNIQELFKKFTK